MNERVPVRRTAAVIAICAVLGAGTYPLKPQHWTEVADDVTYSCHYRDSQGHVWCNPIGGDTNDGR